MMPGLGKFLGIEGGRGVGFVVLQALLPASVSEASLRGEIKRVEASLRGEIKRVEASFQGEIKRVESSLRGEIKSVEASLEGRMVALEGQMVSLRLVMLAGFGFLGVLVALGNFL